MRIDSNLQKLEIYFVAVVAVVLVTGASFALSTPFSVENYGVSDGSMQAHQTASQSAPAAAQESLPALLEPALRNLDGVASHG